MGSSLVHGSDDPGSIPALYVDLFFFFFPSLVKSLSFLAGTRHASANADICHIM